MAPKDTAGKAVQQAPPTSSRAQRTPSSIVQNSQRALSPLTPMLGNQAMLELLQSGQIQAKLRVSQPGDADEVEADRVAEQFDSAKRPLAIQRKCACAGATRCATCAGEEEEEKVHRSVAPLALHRAAPSIQRQTSDKPQSQGAAAAAQTLPSDRSHPTFLVEEGAGPLSSGQMHKGQLLDLLHAHVCATADAALASVGRSSKSCPYIGQWLGFYATQSAQYIDR